MPNKLLEFLTYDLEEVIDEDKLIQIHIKVENLYSTKNCIDKLHTYLFRNYSTIVGYKKRYKKYNSDMDQLFPYGTAILGVVIIMTQRKDAAALAKKEAAIICPHPQSLLACDGIIELCQNKDLNKVKDLVKDDEQLLNVCNGPQDTNINFLQDWVRHYFLVAISGSQGWTIDLGNSVILEFIYNLMHQYFFNSEVL